MTSHNTRMSYDFLEQLRIELDDELGAVEGTEELIHGIDLDLGFDVFLRGVAPEYRAHLIEVLRVDRRTREFLTRVHDAEDRAKTKKIVGAKARVGLDFTDPDHDLTREFLLHVQSITEEDE